MYFITNIGHDPEVVFANFSFAMQHRPIGDLLSSIPAAHFTDMSRYYLKDLINTTWRSSLSRPILRKTEMQVIKFGLAIHVKIDMIGLLIFCRLYWIRWSQRLSNLLIMRTLLVSARLLLLSTWHVTSVMMKSANSRSL